MPSKTARAMMDYSKDSKRSSGPDTAREWRLIDRPPKADATERARKVFEALIEMSADTPHRLRFAPEGQELFNEWLSELESKIRGGHLHPALAAHLAKYRSLMPSVGLLF